MRIALAAAAVVLSLTARGSAAVPTAADILKRSMAHYDTSKTFQGVMLITTKKTGVDMTMRVDIKIQNDGKGSIRQRMLKVDTDVAGSSGRRKQQQVMGDDGHTVYVVYPAVKRYISQPHRTDRVSRLFERSLTNLTKVAGDLAVSTRTVEGRPCYALTGTKTGSNVLILIDKSSLELRALTMVDGSNISKMTVTQQIFDQPIPASTFKWSPPAGYQLVAPGTVGG